MMIMAVLVVSTIAVYLLIIGAISPFWICIGEILVFSVLLLMHIKGYYLVSRYIFFVIAIIMQMYGSFYHGENGGFDFLFFVTALCPVLFFDNKFHYSSLFIFSITAFILVKVLYNFIDPIMPLERQIIPYYSNIVISGLLIYSGYVLFKSEHVKYEQTLREQKTTIEYQKEALSIAKEQLEDVLKRRTNKIKEQDRNIAQYTFLNSHKVRSPLARILGLLNLTKYEDLNIEDTRQYYFKELKVNAEELDVVLKKINQVLNKNME